MSGADNAFATYLFQLERQFYREPTAGFKQRLEALMALTALHMALGLAYILINALSMLKRNGGGGIWLFRVVRRGADRFALFNARLTGPIGTVAWGAVNLAYLEDSKAIFIDGAAYTTTSWALRGLQFIPLFIGGWATTAAFLQAFFLATTATSGRRLFSTLAWNWVIALGGLALLSLQLGCAIWQTIEGKRLWSQYETFHATLERLATAPVLDVSALAGVSPAYNAFLASVDRWKASTVIQYTTLFLLPLFCLSLNLGGLLLARRLRRQSATQLHRLSMGSFNVDLNTVTDEPTVAPPPPLVDPDRRGSTTSALRKLAVKKHAEGDVEMELASQQAVELLGMLKAESDLVTHCVSIAMGSAFVLIFSIYIAALVGSGGYINGKWPLFEAGMFAIAWGLGIIFPILYATLIYNEMQLRRVHRAAGEPRRLLAVSTGGDV